MTVTIRGRQNIVFVYTARIILHNVSGIAVVAPPRPLYSAGRSNPSSSRSSRRVAAIGPGRLPVNLHIGDQGVRGPLARTSSSSKILFTRSSSRGVSAIDRESDNTVEYIDIM